MKLVQMPRELLHLEDADLDGAGVEAELLAAFRSFLPRALEERRGLAILAPAETGGHRMLMVLARRIGTALRDENIRLRERGGDLKAQRRKLCYLPGGVLGEVLGTPSARAELVREAACFFQDLDEAWQEPGHSSATGSETIGHVEEWERGRPGRPGALPNGGGRDGRAPRTGNVLTFPGALLSLLDERLAAGRPAFVNAAPERLPPGLADALRVRLPTVELPGSSGT